MDEDIAIKEDPDQLVWPIYYPSLGRMGAPINIGCTPTEPPGIDLLSQSSYSASINLAHRSSEVKHEQQADETQAPPNTGFGFVDVNLDKIQSSELTHTPDIDPLQTPSNPLTAGTSYVPPHRIKLPDFLDQKPPGLQNTLLKDILSFQGFPFDSQNWIHRSRPNISIPLQEPQHSETERDETSDNIKTSTNFLPEFKEPQSDIRSNAEYRLNQSSSSEHICCVCSKKLRSGCELRWHLQLHATPTRHKCVHCEAMFTTEGDLKNHREIHVVAEPCTSKPSSETLAKSSERGVSTRELQSGHHYSCNICKETFNLKHLVNEHKKSHKRVKPCRPIYDMCNAIFYSKSTLTSHKVVYTGEKRFFCKVCKESFAEEGDLKIHRDFHVIAEPCASKPSSETLAKSSECSVSTGKRQSGYWYYCDVCKKKFHFKHLFNTH